MTTIEKIKAEIERLIEESDFDESANLYSLLSFLSTLEEEPVSDDIEEEAYNHIRRVADAAGHPGWDWETQDIVDAFIAGAKWQKQHDDKELSDLLTIAHLQGAEQMKEQMMKEAVEGEIVKDISNRLVVTAKNVNLDKFKFGEKVRIIIVKE